MENIESELNKLPEEKRKEFDEILRDVLYDRDWCFDHNIDYANPDICLAKKQLYHEMFAKV